MLQDRWATRGVKVCLSSAERFVATLESGLDTCTRFAHAPDCLLRAELRASSKVASVRYVLNPIEAVPPDTARCPACSSHNMLALARAHAAVRRNLCTVRCALTSRAGLLRVRRKSSADRSCDATPAARAMIPGGPSICGADATPPRACRGEERE
eukprot:6187308-Pleurochrysis_carterae.AAC.6